MSLRSYIQRTARHTEFDRYGLNHRGVYAGGTRMQTHMKSKFLITAAAIALATLTAQSAFAAPMPQPSFHTKGSSTGKPTGPLKPGEYWWNPRVSPAGPVVLLVSLPLQTMHVYRNGILVGRTSISSGTKNQQNSDRRLHHSREKADPSLEEIRQRANAEHAAADLERHRDALGQSARVSRQPRLHPDAV